MIAAAAVLFVTGLMHLFGSEPVHKEDGGGRMIRSVAFVRSQVMTLWTVAVAVIADQLPLWL
jgi:hypothetical protein